MVTLKIKHSRYYEDGYHEGWCNFSVNEHEFYGYGEPADYNTTEIDYWLDSFEKLERNLLEKRSYYFWQFSTDGWWLGFDFIGDDSIKVISCELNDRVSELAVEAELPPDGLRVKHGEVTDVAMLLKAVRSILSEFNR